MKKITYLCKTIEENLKTFLEILDYPLPTSVEWKTIMGGISSSNKSMKIDIKWFCCVNRIAVSEMGLEYTSEISVSL